MGALPVQGRQDQLVSKWKLIRVAYIIPVFHEARNGEICASSNGRWVAATSRKPKPGNRGMLPDALQEAFGTQRAEGMTGKLLGGPILRALGLVESSQVTSSPIRESWIPDKLGPSIPYVAEWSAERVTFTLGKIRRKFLIVEVQLDSRAPVEHVLTNARYRIADAVKDMRVLDKILAFIEPDVYLRGDGGISPIELGDLKEKEGSKALGEKVTPGISLNSRFVVSSVTTAVPSGPGLPPPPSVLAEHEEWEAREKWGYFLATHQPNYRKLPANSRERAVRGCLDKMAAWNVRVEPFGTSVLSNDSMLGGAWDQLNLLKASVNPFVELTLLSYWQHACIESFTDQLANQAWIDSDTSPKKLRQHLEELRQFGNEYFAFRNSAWFDAVPNQGYWTSYLRMLQDRFGDREAVKRLSVDYADWSTHLANQLALEEAERKERNERQIKSFSALGGLAAITFALLTLLVEPAKEDALLWAPGLAIAFAVVACGLGIGFFLSRHWSQLLRSVKHKWGISFRGRRHGRPSKPSPTTGTL